jgi:hypothetical protein
MTVFITTEAAMIQRGAAVKLVSHRGMATV